MADQDASWKNLSTNDVITRIGKLAAGPEGLSILIPLLDERSTLFDGKGERDVDRIRGYILSRFNHRSLPRTVIPYIREELELGRLPFGVVGAALALRNDATVAGDLIDYLTDAAARFQYDDVTFSLEKFDFAPEHQTRTSVLTEILQTLYEFRRVGLSPSCCSSHNDKTTDTNVSSPGSWLIDPAAWDIQLQDQNGALTTFAEAIAKRPTFLVFFYTRCTNPEKCSLTISKLADLNRAVEGYQLRGRVNLFGISYDEAFDLPNRLNRFGLDRGMAFSSTSRLFRTTGAFKVLSQMLDLAVGFGPITVNRHRLDAMIFDRAGKIHRVYRRQLWLCDEVLKSLSALCK